MTYFTSDFLSFFTDLRANNERDWFKANKKSYEEAIKKPFEAFIAAMIERIQIEDPELVITPKDCIFRIYRDTRFSKDKTPYKLHASAAINRGGRKDHSRPGIYLEANDEKFSVYSGVYQADTKTLLAIRESIAGNMEEFADLVADPVFVKTFGSIQGEKNKRIPKEFRELAEQQALLFNKQFYYFHEFEANAILQDNLVEQVMECYQASRPLSRFFEEAIYV